MANAPERLIDAQRTLLETSQNIGLKGLEGAARLFELNLQTMNNMLGAGAERMSNAASADSSRPYQALGALQPDGRAVAAYMRQAAEIVSSTNGEIARLVQQQALGLQSLAGEMMSATMSSAPAAGDALQSMMRDPFGAMQRSISQATGMAGRSGDSAVQAGESAVEAAVRATAQAAESATRAGRRQH